MADTDLLDGLENDKIIAKVEKFFTRRMRLLSWYER